MSKQPNARPLVPDHVPASLVRDFDIFKLDLGEDPQAAIGRAVAGFPRAIFMPCTIRFPDFGSWLFTHEADIRAIMQDAENFTCHGISNFDAMTEGEQWLALPSEADPPEHTAYRGLLNPLFSPRRVTGYEAALRQHVCAVLDRIVPEGRANFTDIARELPAGVFAQFLGLSIAETLHAMDQSRMIMHSGYDVELRTRGMRGLIEIQSELVRKRRIEPSDDLISLALAAHIDGRPLTDMELRGIFVFFLLAGVETSASATGFLFRHLARNPAERSQVANSIETIPDLIEESLRRYTQITTNRFVKNDIEVGGVALKKGDHVFCSMVLANIDQEAFPQPLTFDAVRCPNRHFSFGAGIHRCLGSNIARVLLRIIVEEWFVRVSDFWIPEGVEIRTINSEALVLENLQLEWVAR